MDGNRRYLIPRAHRHFGEAPRRAGHRHQGEPDSPGAGASDRPSISPDGRFVAFESDAADLVAGDANGASDIFLRDTCAGEPPGCTPSTVRVSVAEDGAEGAGASWEASVAAAGRYVAFCSSAPFLVAGDGTGDDLFVRDTCIGASGCTPTTFRETALDPAGGSAAGECGGTALSADGRFVAFYSRAELLAGVSGRRRAWLRGTCRGATSCTPATILLSRKPDGSVSAGGVAEAPLALSADGRYVAFTCFEKDQLEGATSLNDVLVRDTCTGASGGCTPASRLVSSAAGAPGDDASERPSITADGRYVAFFVGERSRGRRPERRFGRLRARHLRRCGRRVLAAHPPRLRAQGRGRDRRRLRRRARAAAHRRWAPGGDSLRRLEPRRRRHQRERGRVRGGDRVLRRFTPRESATAAS
jgi:hypothetical protein